MPYTIRIRDDLSLQDILNSLKQGIPTFKTPHIGNFYPNNLAIAALGIPLKLVDQTKGQKDTNFHPHCIIRDGTRHPVTCPNILSTHTTLRCEKEAQRLGAPVGSSMQEIHLEALQRAIPQTQAEPWSCTVRRLAEYIEPILEVTTCEFPGVWQRRVDKDGLTHLARVKGWAEVKKHGVFGVHHPDHGLIIPNILNILMDGLLDGMLGNSPEIYHLSGPDMVRYIGQLEQDLHRLYDHAHQALGWNVAEEVIIHMIPAADMRFVVPMRQRTELDDLLSAWFTVQKSDKYWADRFRQATPDEYKQLGIKKRQERGKHIGRLRNAARACRTPFYAIEDGTYLSQYDLEPGEELYIPDWAMHTPMRDISAAYTAICRLI